MYLLSEALKTERYLKDDYIADIRQAFRICKNRRNKYACTARKKIREATANAETEIKFEEIMYSTFSS